MKPRLEINPEEDEEFDNPELLKAKQKQQLNRGVTKGVPLQEKQMPGRMEPNIENNRFHEKDDSKHQINNENSFNFTLYEYLMSGFVVLFLINWYLGKSQNDILAMKWFNANKSFFTYNYAHIGHENNYAQFNMNSPFL